MPELVCAPCAGQVIDLAQTPDPVFASRSVGDGIALAPAPSGNSVTMLAPVSGEVIRLLPHAYVILTEGGQAVMTHIGINTVRLQGEGFIAHLEQGQQVSQGQPMITYRPEILREHGCIGICPVVVLGRGLHTIRSVNPTSVRPGDPLFYLLDDQPQPANTDPSPAADHSSEQYFLP
ncbi:PTS glucose transporter subunit IIA [Corynebacterium choanae]|uniref:Glucose-specific phosphotransferase enzyme IIA component n=1 Tax=Corynebacterium choanae TaxID=1862358 RepID=A0A3G6J6M0_9CORY|nr:PTS glucose transporter subunit IIA [Corynebacterium choanae]AZA13751.1 Glucose-specific phosphotransferase enzyme IIA component [Corynebacterium choanae]